MHGHGRTSNVRKRAFKCVVLGKMILFCFLYLFRVPPDRTMMKEKDEGSEEEGTKNDRNTKTKETRKEEEGREERGGHGKRSYISYLLLQLVFFLTFKSRSPL
jgi:hypothetical protein